MPKVKVTGKRAGTKPSKKPETQQPESPTASPETSLAPTPESSPRSSPEPSPEPSREPSQEPNESISEKSQESDDLEQHIHDLLKENNCETFTFQKLIKHLSSQDKDDIKQNLKELILSGVLKNKNGKPVLPGQLMFNENYEKPAQQQEEVEASEEEEESDQSSQESSEMSTRQETRKDQESYQHEVTNEKPSPNVQKSKNFRTHNSGPEIQVFHQDNQTQTEGLTPLDESISDESVLEERETAGDPLESSTPIFLPIRSRIKKKVKIQQPLFEESEEDDNTPPTPNPVTPPKRKRERETKKVKNARKKAKK